MKLPEELVTVTPLSKTVALLLFISLPVISFVLGVRYQAAMNSFKVSVENSKLSKPITTPVPLEKKQTGSKSCIVDQDCQLLTCAGCYNKEYAKGMPIQPPCTVYENYSCTCQNNTCTPKKKLGEHPLPGTQEKYISGVIQSFSNNMASDGNCEITVNNQKIAITITGDRQFPPSLIGNLQGIKCSNAGDDLTEFIGKKVDAYGLWNGYYLSIEGDTKYYIVVSEK